MVGILLILVLIEMKEGDIYVLILLMIKTLVIKEKRRIND
jgi:hypothetical protein